MTVLWQDVKYALRMLQKNPGFTAVAVLTLALGIGANTAIFSLIDALMLRWLPVRHPQELIQLKLQAPGAAPAGESFSYAMVLALADQTEIFSGVAGFASSDFDVGPPGSDTRVPGAVVTGAYYQTLGLDPAVGRLLTRDDDKPGAAVVAVLSYGYWERQFAGNPGVLGQTMVMNGVPATIVGVSPRGFVGANVGSIADITIPVAAWPRIKPQEASLLERGNFWWSVLARPRTGVSVPEAQARLSAVWPQISESVIAPTWPAARRKAMADAVFQWSSGGTGWTNLRKLYRRPLWVLMGAVVVVLLITCANVASLLLARASARQREMAVRLAIGAGRGRIIRLLLTESALLSLIGGGFGIWLAWFSGRFLVNMISTARMHVVFDLTPNAHVLGFAMAVAIGTAILFGLAPALHTTSAGPMSVLKQETTMTTSPSRLLPSLVSTQVALALVLLIGAGLFVRTLQNLRNFDPGFNRKGVLLVDLEGRRTAVPPQLLQEMERVTGVVSASVSTHTPLSGAIWSEPAVPKGQPIPGSDNAYFVGAGPRFFATMQIPLLAGREFTNHDSAGVPAVCVINEAYAYRHFPTQNPVGQFLSAMVRGQRRDLEIVGLVKNTSAAGLRKAPPPMVYVSYAQLTGSFPTTLEIRARGSLGQVASAISRVLQAKLPGPRVEVRAFSTQVEDTMVQEQMMATLASAFGLLAIGLACIGLYGLLSYTVARRTKEIGIRMALGAERRTVLKMVLREGLLLTTVGIGVGLALGVVLTRLISSQLYNLSATDPATFTTVSLFLTFVVLAASYLPARRATRVDPLVALRYQ